MHKHILSLVAATALCTTPALAQDSTYNDNTYFPGFYVGGFAGYTDSEADTSVGDVDIDGGDYGVFVGFEADRLLDETINRTGLGLTGAIELSYAWSDADGDFATADLEKKNEYGISFRPGIKFLSDTMPLGLNPYGIIGYKRTEFEAEVGGASADETYGGFELGIGTQLMAYGDYGVRLDYAHTWYEEKDDIEPEEDTIRLGVSYHF